MSKKVQARLTTPYMEQLRENDIPYSEYPRPQFKRNSYLTLNGYWDFAITKGNALPEIYQEKIRVPFPPESQLSGICRSISKKDTLIYRRSFTLPHGFIKDRLILHVDAADEVSAVYVNGKYIGSCEGGYIPTSYDITDSISCDGENEIIIKVTDKLSGKYPYGKQRRRRGGMWYTPVSGIWQSVWLESIPKMHIQEITLSPTDNYVTISIKTDAKEKNIHIKETDESFSFTENEITIAPREIHKWTPENPYLYSFTLSTETDMIESYFALRQVEIKNIGGKKLCCLNGKPYLFNGLLDQGYYPDGIFLPATSDGFLDDILLAKALGFNMLRKHIKIEPLIFYHLCDKHGIFVFQDMVNNSSYSFIIDTALPTIGLTKLPSRHRNPEKQQIFRNTMLKTIDLLRNCPSIVEYTIFNEGWGQFKADEMYNLAKGYDKTRLYDSASGWFTPKKNDFDSRHIYFKPLIVKKRNDSPLFISEFGGYSLRIPGHLFGEGNYGYKFFSNKNDLENALETLYLREASELIKQGLSALVFTQLSDVEDETNGFVTYDRRVVKVDATRMKQINNELTMRFNALTE